MLKKIRSLYNYIYYWLIVGTVELVSLFIGAKIIFNENSEKSIWVIYKNHITGKMPKFELFKLIITAFIAIYLLIIIWE